MSISIYTMSGARETMMKCVSLLYSTIFFIDIYQYRITSETFIHCLKLTMKRLFFYHHHHHHHCITSDYLLKETSRLKASNRDQIMNKTNFENVEAALNFELVHSPYCVLFYHNRGFVSERKINSVNSYQLFWFMILYYTIHDSYAERFNN